MDDDSRSTGSATRSPALVPTGIRREDYSDLCIVAIGISRDNLLADLTRLFLTETMTTRILIADDNPMVRHYLGQLLSTHLGWEVCEAADGKDAVQKTLQLSPDVVVLDFLMPGCNGIEAAREISKTCPNTPMLLCTIYLSPQLLELARKAGIAGALSKGELTHLVRGVEAVLAGDTFFPAIAS